MLISRDIMANSGLWQVIRLAAVKMPAMMILVTTTVSLLVFLFDV